ncbi:FHA domain-containing protein [Shewanella sp. D64]|uniref:FHA domain-containing protein n=1 Tax=unclassified Shewanella TaxID=196818 RepID=UPI0022BA4A3C|nr:MULTISPECIES: FHA domain-containing protein [unclassified Shewanella]MEC4725744.1 FHA domain-containing protein [Shewanella sp. D64]MEC4737649.1 FHA domain-containing protein [Shewanella sp. E94]WBJ93458.1 FHA domain-containing protein [Shewanella sp. MTB7]
MAYIIDPVSSSKIYLYAHHSFGRLAYSVNTLISQPDISKIHAIIEWNNGIWSIRDISTNGCWLNKIKIFSNKRYPLKAGDKINFASLDNQEYRLESVDAPADLLIPCTSQDSKHLEQAITLGEYNLLPQENPELALFRDRKMETWKVSSIDCETDDSCTLAEDEIIEFQQQKWQLHLSHLEPLTQALQASQLTLEDITFDFYLSLDEEVSQLKVHTPESILDLHVRSHHYLTLNLARYRSLSAEQGLDESEQGWVYAEQLVKDLGIEIHHLNIQIHRARKQFSDSINVNDAEYIIQRQAGKIRFGSTHFNIYKGHKLECGLHQTNKLSSVDTQVQYETKLQ